METLLIWGIVPWPIIWHVSCLAFLGKMTSIAVAVQVILLMIQICCIIAYLRVNREYL